MTDDYELPHDGHPTAGGRPSDDDLVALVGAVLDEEEPLPDGAVDFAASAFAWRDLDVELAELLHDSIDGSVLAVRDNTPDRVLVFRAVAVTLEAEWSPRRVIGAVAPPACYRVELHDGAGPPNPNGGVVTDDSGVFASSGNLRGPLRFVVSTLDGEVVLVSPWVIR